MNKIFVVSLSTTEEKKNAARKRQKSFITLENYNLAYNIQNQKFIFCEKDLVCRSSLHRHESHHLPTNENQAPHDAASFRWLSNKVLLKALLSSHLQALYPTKGRGHVTNVSTVRVDSNDEITREEEEFSEYFWLSTKTGLEKPLQ